MQEEENFSMLSRRSIVLGGVSAVFSTSLLVEKTSAALPSVEAEPWAQKLIAAAESQVGTTVHYDPAYTQLKYPGGDVPLDRGVCTDVIIRAYRQGLNADLQALVHNDMRKAFTQYPRNWGLKRRPEYRPPSRAEPCRIFQQEQSGLTGYKSC